ncbi:ROK family transcriptional regulator [Microbacterium pygmaeum]|uniref:Sugar kinase of the NBD/HSP70 family, may contain an N-terminal HTH domain n=1 Tax=Microbacterium pygmaeum TaxID=370764 RepID=A0A1G7X9N9_9MICO|nr:ROK family transcriptional regulator [Microbacterium pygmaeum]SDG80955.1 Sugar kinase of the NBD/HSP70 family, may contain an N-terminal HTH domain [Microbacterium pygmaeum]
MAVRDNSGAVLDLIRSAGIISRVELAQHSGLTEASISRIVKLLIADGLVAETGRGTSTGGKRPTLLELNRSARHAVGIYLSNYRTRFVLTDLSGRVVAHSESPTGIVDHRRSEAVREATTIISALLTAAQVSRESLLGIGIAVPGRQEVNRYLQSTQPEDWTEWDWASIQQDFAEGTGMWVSIENDSTCGAIGEFWISRAPAARDLAVVTMASGIGFGLITDGDVYRGATSNVGELGHVVVDANGPECECGSRGCLELYASPGRIVQRALTDDILAGRLALSGDAASLWADYERIAIAAANDDEGARAVIVHAAHMLSVALVSITNILDLERVVLTGPALDHVGALVAETVRAELAERAFARNVHTIDVRVSDSGRDAAAVGAASLVIHQRLGATRRDRAGSSSSTDLSAAV